MAHRRFAFIPFLPLILGVACYPTGEGVAPLAQRMYFPTGLGVSPGGSVLYVANSNFDLQYDGGTLQAFDLDLLRAVSATVAENFGALPGGPAVAPCGGVALGIALKRGGFGEPCATPSEAFYRNHRVIGAFATDLRLANTPFLRGGAPSRRMFVPVGGDASVTWVDVPDDTGAVPAGERFALRCGSPNEASASPGGSCDTAHHTGQNPSEPGNSRGIVLPGEPFGIAFSEDEQALALTHQTVERVSLLSTGLVRGAESAPPALQFVLEGVNVGGVGIHAIPHDGDAVAPGLGPRPAFLQSTRVRAELTRIRFYPDESFAESSTLRRPFMVREQVFAVNASASGTDSRSILIDPSPREVCKSKVAASDPLRASKISRCARVPARLFVANRSPASLIVGEVGGEVNTDPASYDPDTVRVFENIPLNAGPTTLHLAPIVDRDGGYALRVFIACYDSGTVFVYDPEARAVEAIIRTAPGPFAMAFDPFDMKQAVQHAQVATGAKLEVTQRTYRYGYIASFTNSVVQVLDLDNARPANTTFERILLTLGEPSKPKGTN
jgi:hypothetical protein